MFKRLHLIVWCVAALIPLGGWLHQRPYFAAVSGAIYIAGWWALRAALKHDPEGQVLRGFGRTRTARIGLVLAAVELTVVALNHERSALSLLMLLIVTVWTLWALSTSPRQLASRAARLLLVCGSLALCLAVGETVLIARDAMRPRNDGKTWTWGHQVKNNRFGFRERDFQIPKPAGTYRIMVLGDSLTWGAGLAEQQRYTNLLQQRLRRQHPELNVEVLNFALSGCPTVTERDILLRYVDQVDPDRIVVGFCVNDPQPKDGYYAVELERYRLLLNACKLVHDLGAHRVGRLLYLRTDQLLRNLGLVPQGPDALDRVYDPNSPEWQQFSLALKDIASAARCRHQPPPLFAPLLYGNGDFSHPDRHAALMLRWCRQAAEAARAAGFEVVSLEKPFMQQGFQRRWVNPWDSHPSAECNKIYADGLAKAISDDLSMATLARRQQNTHPAR